MAGRNRGLIVGLVLLTAGLADIARTLAEGWRGRGIARNRQVHEGTLAERTCWQFAYMRKEAGRTEKLNGYFEKIL
jgi:hypothetical protein